MSKHDITAGFYYRKLFNSVSKYQGVTQITMLTLTWCDTNNNTNTNLV